MPFMHDVIFIIGFANVVRMDAAVDSYFVCVFSLEKQLL